MITCFKTHAQATEPCSLKTTPELSPYPVLPMLTWGFGRGCSYFRSRVGGKSASSAINCQIFAGLRSRLCDSDVALSVSGLRFPSGYPTAKFQVSVRSWKREPDSNRRPDGYEPSELPTALPRVMFSNRQPTFVEPVLHHCDQFRDFFAVQVMTWADPQI